MRILKCSLMAAFIAPVLSLSVSTAGPAGADCANAAGLSVCSGADAGPGAVPSLPYYHYPCDLDPFCSTGSLSLLDPEPGGLNTDNDVDVDIGQPGPGGLNADRSGGPDRGGREGGS